MRHFIGMVLLFCGMAIAANEPMTLVYKTSSPNAIITLPLRGAVVNVAIDWGDGSSLETMSVQGNATHTYSTANTYNVKITGTLQQFGDPNKGINRSLKKSL